MTYRRRSTRDFVPKATGLLYAAFVIFALPSILQGSDTRKVPDHIPPKRSSQTHDGFGINVVLPREPFFPPDHWWWTRMFDAGIGWARIGQYHNSSEQTSWDWVERERGKYSLAPEVDDDVDSLIDNGVKIQLQLLYGNPLYTAQAGKFPDSIIPAPGPEHPKDVGIYSIFWPPKTSQQISAFIDYTKWMVNHFRGRIHYYALWNEEDIDFWNGTAEDYGRLLKEFAKAVHETDPEAKVIFGGVANSSPNFARRALEACQCAAGIDVFAYHTYPGWEQNMYPESMDSGAFGAESPAKLREFILHYPGIRSDITFWDDEYNHNPTSPGIDESVQEKYIPRGLLYNWAAGVRTFIWTFLEASDGNEGEGWGILYGRRYLSSDFKPRPVFRSLQNTNALFSDTEPDPSIRITIAKVDQLQRQTGYRFFAYGFRFHSGKAIVAYWLGAQSVPGGSFPPYFGNMAIENSGIKNPVLIDVDSGDVRPVEWKKGTTNVLEPIPVRDGVLAIADADYFDWPVLAETPGPLIASSSNGHSVKLTWEVHGGDPTSIVIERRVDDGGAWEKIARLSASATVYVDSQVGKSHEVRYRVCAVNNEGESAFSNIARVQIALKQ
jgi:hypothetical protein